MRGRAQRRGRARGWGAALLASVLVAQLAAGAPQAETEELSREINFSIAPQPLAAALIQFSDQSGVQLLSADAGIARVWSNGIRGRLPVDAALRRLLVGTRLEFEAIGEDTVALISASHARRDRASAIPSASTKPVLQGPAGSDELQGLLGQVVVTAQKREESLQQAPLSISVLTQADLEDRGVSSLTDMLAGGVPSLRVSTFIGRTSTLSMAMRGINSGDSTQISRDSGVGVYLDGVYLGRTQALGGELLEIERMEVVRGPQGTLFGRNAVGGAINIISRKPSGELDVTQTVGLRSQDGLKIVSRLDLPRARGFSVKLDGALNERGGLVENDLPSAWDFSEYKRWGVRGQVLWDGADNFSALYSYDRSEDRATPYYLHITELLPTARPLAPMFSVEPRPVKHARTGVPLEPSVGESGGHSLVFTWELDDALTLKSIGAYREIDQSQFDNWAGTTESFRPNRLFGRTSIARVRQHQLSEELQLSGTFDRLSFVGGAYYFDENASDGALEFYSNRFNDTGTGATVVQMTPEGVDLTRASVNHTESSAVFGHLSWRPPVLSDRLNASVALRYTTDHKSGRLTALFGESPPPHDRYAIETSRLDPSASLAFQLTPDVNAYLRWDVGYRAGGASSRSVSFRSFGPEELESWELGIKSELWNHAARLNVALYDMTYSDLQVGFFSPENPVNAETINTDRPASIRGAEVDAAVSPTPRLKLSGSYAYTWVHIPDQANPFTGELTRLVPIYSPRHAVSAALEYDVAAFDFGSLSVYADANYAGPQYSVINDTTRSRASLLVNSRVTLRDVRLSGSRLSFAVWCKNLFDRRYELADFNSSIGEIVIFGDPRSYGLDVTLNF
jgi:iron complex outermembrane recepter protein